MNTADTKPPATGIDETFPHKVCINLDRRPERWRQMQLKFARHGVGPVQRFSALDGDSLRIPAHWSHTPGAYGCLRSHLQVVVEARELGLPSVLIFEDDAVFDPHLQEKFSAYVEQLPPDWDMLYFGALHKDELAGVSDNIFRLTRSNSTYAYALRETVFDAFIELNRKAEDVLDNNCFILQKQFNCYCFIPHLAWVETGYSDAQRRLERHWYLQESLVLFGAGVDRLLSETTVVLAHDARTSSGRAAGNVIFLANYYHEFFSPYIEIIVVEQGARPTLERAALPPGCKHVFLPNDGAFRRERCLATGIEHSNPNREIFILSDDDIYLETLDIRANLRMCERYDCATGFDKIVDLSDEDSLRLLDTKTTRGIDITAYAPPTEDARAGYYRFATRAALRALRENEEGVSGKGLLALKGLPALSRAGQQFLLQTEQRLLPQAEQRLRVFRSPNHALRLRR